MPRRKSVELTEEQKAMLAKLPALEKQKLLTHFIRPERRKKDSKFYQTISLEEIDEKITSLENYYIREIAKIIVDQYVLFQHKTNGKLIKSQIDLYQTISNHLTTKTKLKTSNKFIESVIKYMYEKAGYLHIKNMLPALELE